MKTHLAIFYKVGKRSVMLQALFVLLSFTAYSQRTWQDIVAEMERNVEVQDSLFQFVINENIEYELKDTRVRISNPPEAVLMVQEMGATLEAVINHLNEDDDQDYATYLILCDISNFEVTENRVIPNLSEFKKNKQKHVDVLDTWVDGHTTW
jgi:hypothetical protein